MKNLLTFSILNLIILTQAFSNKQDLYQTIRGKVIDKDTKMTLIGATVIIVGSDPVIGTVTDRDGNFRLEKVAIGRKTIKISYLGYTDRVISNIMLTSGKELVLNIELEESLIELDEAVVKARQNKTGALNEMASVSARTFSVEETQRYAASILDPARMVQNYAGVGSGDDLSNEIIVRGNTPRGILWRLEGIQIPNPNHFGGMGNSGGGVSMLSSSTLATSDFYTGAFPAEFGNAISGVFDLRFRSGNNEKRESSFMIGVMGVEASTEGYFRKGSSSSYLINYRYSTLGLLKPFFTSLGDIMPTYQDLSYKFNFPTKHAGTFAIFGLAGYNNINIDHETDSTKWEDWEKEDSLLYDYEEAQFVNVVGLSHILQISSKTYLKSVFAYTIDNYYALGYEVYPYDDFSRLLDEDSDFKNYTFSANISLNHKFNKKHTVKTGVIYDQYNFNFRLRYRWDSDTLKSALDNSGTTSFIQAYAQWKYRLNESLTFLGGVHYSYLTLNGNYTIEPRAALQWSVNPKHKLSFAVGKHSKPEHPSTYYLETTTANSEVRIMPNKNLEFISSNHFVLGYDYLINPNLRLKAEVYYQYLYNVPVEKDPSSLETLLNTAEIWDLIGSKPADNSGTGENKGIDLTFEKFLSNDSYFLITTSIYDSKYTVHGRTFNTRYNNNYLFNALYGKEWKVGKSKNNVIGVNTKFKLLGGQRYNAYDQSKIDSLKSIYGNLTWNDFDYEDIIKDGVRYSAQSPAYFRIDLGISFKINRPKATHTIMIDIQNLTNRQNIYSQYFDADTDEIEYWYNNGIIPIINYRIEF